MPAGPEHDLPLGQRALRSFLELLALTGFAVVQPILDVFGRAPDRFLLRGASAFEIVLFALLVATVPAIVLWCIEWVSWAAGERVRVAVHTAFVGLLVGLFFLQALRRTDTIGGLVLLLVAAAFGVGGVVVYRRWRVARTWLAVTSGAIVLYLAAFLVLSPTAELLTSDDVEPANAATVEDPRPVVILQFDEWPLSSIIDGNGEIDADIYPNLAALAADGTWFRNATTVATYTNYAVPSTLTGRYPDGEAVPTAAAYPENLFTMLARDYELEVQEVVTRLCPTSLCEAGGGGGGMSSLLGDATDAYSVMVSPDLDRRLDPGAVFAEEDAVPVPNGPYQASNFGLADDPVLRLASVDELVNGIVPEAEPTLHYLHLILPHEPYRFLPSGQAYEDPLAWANQQGDPFGAEPERASDPVAVRTIQQRLVLQAQYADAIVGQVVDRLEETGQYDEAVVAVVADHGIGFVPGQPTREVPEAGAEAEDRAALYSDLLAVPLLIKGPDLTPGEVSDANAETIDLLPTVAELIDAEIPWPVDGVSLVSDERSTDQKRFQIVENPVGGIGGASSLSEPIELDGSDLLAETLGRNLDTVFTGGTPFFGTYAVAGAAELVGRPVRELTVGEASPWELSVDALDRLAQYDEASGVMPARLSGRLAGPPAGQEPDQRPMVVVAVNGQVAAVVETHPLGEVEHRVEAMLVPAFIQTGRNDVAFYVVDGPVGARVLHPLSTP